MKLIVEQEDTIQEIDHLTPKAHIIETKPLRFRLLSNIYIDSPLLYFGNQEVELEPVQSKNNEFVYESLLSNYFLNNVGLTTFELIDANGKTYDRLGYANVLSSKINSERLYEMLCFISAADAKLLHCCFSKTFMQNRGDDFKYTDLNFKLLLTEKALQFLWDNKNKFKNQACKRVSSKQVVKEYSPKDLIDDRAYNWIFSHLDELQYSDRPENALIQIYSRKYQAKNIATSVITEDKDIFENQVIYCFLMQVKHFLNSLDDLFTSKEKSKIKIDSTAEFVDIVPFIQKFVYEKKNSKNQLINRLSNLLDSNIKFFAGNLTSTYIPNLRPKITQYVSRHSHYKTLYGLINQWWNINASNPTDSVAVDELLFSLKSLDKVYELFVLLNLIQAFELRGLLLKNAHVSDYCTFPSLSVNPVQREKYDNEIHNYYALESQDLTIELYYEPCIFPWRENLTENELFIVDKEPDNKKRDAPSLYNAKYIRTPDYLLCITNKTSGKICRFVIDAKFSSYETVLYDRLPSKSRGSSYRSSLGLVDKYLHGIRVNTGGKNTSNMIDGVFATYISGNVQNNKKKVLQGISNYFALDGKLPMPPFVDLVSVRPSKGSSIQENFISKLLDYANT
jgi:hypothetical protein